ncbi:hypothetical protein [Hyphomonas sp.]|uniref:hypothetical protein n=1 Tax=Hyphomonas sp. TaxID=87 RepID=UPI003918853F
MRTALLCLSIVSAGFPANAEAQPHNELTFWLKDEERRTVFLADEGAAGAGVLPTLRICYESAASTPAPQHLMVHLGTRKQSLKAGECGFFSGETVELAIERGSLRAQVVLLR